MKQFADLYITLTHLVDGRYSVEMRLELPDASVDLPPERAEVEIDFPGLRASAFDPQSYGRILNKALFSSPNLEGFFKQALALTQRAGQKVRIRLLSDRNAPELHSLRWETLRSLDDRTNLASDENVYFSRFLYSDEISDVPLVKKGELKALVAVANPAGLIDGKYHDGEGRTLAPIDVEGEISRAENSLRGVKRLSTLASREDEQGRVTLDNLVNELRDGYHILYLVCHGAMLPENPYELDSPLEPYIWLEEKNGAANVLQAEKLVERIKTLDSRKRPLLVVLASCQSAGIGKATAIVSSEDGGALAAIGPRFVQAGIPAVVAMQDNVYMETVAEFMPRFFKELSGDGLVERAMAVARADIQDREDWWVPVLFNRLREGSIFELAEVPKAEQLVPTEESSYDVLGIPNPYPGLRSFTYQDRHLFAGRDSAIQQAVDKITEPGAVQTLTFITGASGSGKSSFAQAGLLPALENYYQIRHKTQRWAVFQPSLRPLARLLDALAVLGMPEITPAEVEDYSADQFSRYLGDNTPADQVNILVIDQFEEIFTQSLPENRTLLFEWLENIATFDITRTHIIATMRSDYLDELFKQQSLWQRAIQDGIDLRAMTVPELKETIQKPLQVACQMGDPGNEYCGKRFESALVDRLAVDASEDATYLPLLQITLQELWNAGRLKLGMYTDLTAAIRQRAEKVYEFSDYDLNQPHDKRSAGDRDLILDVFLDLVNVSLDEDYRRDVRRRRRRVDLEKGSQQNIRLIDDLIEARLLSVSLEKIDGDKIETVDIIHESLIRNWTRLNNTIDEQRKFLKQRARFEINLAEWLMEERMDDFLLQGVRLKEAGQLARRDDIVMRNPDAQALYRRSLDVDMANRQWSLMLRYSLFGLAGGAVGFALAYLVTSWAQFERKDLVPILAIFRLLIGAVAGAGLLLGFAFVRAREQSLVGWKKYLISGASGALAFGLAMLFHAKLNFINDPRALLLIVLEGALWGFAVGGATVWTFSSRLPNWVSLLLAAILGGLVLIVGEWFGDAFLIKNSSAGTSTWQLFLAGALMTVSIITAALVADPYRREMHQD